MNKVSTFNVTNNYGVYPQMMEALELPTSGPRQQYLVNENIFKRVTAALKKGLAVNEGDAKPCLAALKFSELVADLDQATAQTGVPMTVSELALAVGVRDRRVITTLKLLESGKLHVDHKNAEIVDKAVKVVYGLWSATAEKPKSRPQNRRRQTVSK